MNTLTRLALVGLAGGAGTLARYGLIAAFRAGIPGRFPWGTLTVNAAGCLGFGLVLGLAHRHGRLSPDMQAVLLIGFMGGFTTFSTFAFDAWQLWRTGSPAAACVYLAASNLLGLACVLAGLALAGAPVLTRAPSAP